MSADAEPTASGLTDAENQALIDWWYSPWPNDERHVLDTLAEVVARIKADTIATARAEERARLTAAVESVLTEWMDRAGPESVAHRVYGPQVISVLHTVTTVRAALKAADQ